MIRHATAVAPTSASGYTTVTYGVVTVRTTIATVYDVPTLTEANPAVRFAIETFGGSGFFGLKLLVLYACLGTSLCGGVLDDDPVLFYDRHPLDFRLVFEN